MRKRFARRFSARRCDLCRSRRQSNRRRRCCIAAANNWCVSARCWLNALRAHLAEFATAIASTVADPKVFRSGREFAAWLGLVPRQNSTGGKTRLGGITKRGNRYLRRLLINGASANLLRSKATKADPWVIGLRRRRPPLVVAVALANKTARIAWAVMLHQREYQPRAVAA